MLTHLPKSMQYNAYFLIKYTNFILYKNREK